MGKFGQGKASKAWMEPTDQITHWIRGLETLELGNRKFLNAGLFNRTTEFTYEIILLLFYILLVAHHKIRPLFP